MCMLILISVLAGSKCHRNRNFILYIWCDTVMSQLFKPTYWCFRTFHKYMILAEQDCLTLIQTQCFKIASQLCARIGSWNDTYYMGRALNWFCHRLTMIHCWLWFAPPLQWPMQYKYTMMGITFLYMIWQSAMTSQGHVTMPASLRREKWGISRGAFLPTTSQKMFASTLESLTK